MKVLVVSQYYRPEQVPIPESIVLGLRERGHEVVVLTAFPSYPTGRVFDGYRQRRGVVDDVDGVDVHRVPTFISHSRSAIGRMLNYLSFGVAGLLAGRRFRDVDVVYVYATQMTASIAPRWWRSTRKTPFVLHIQDLWPESITGSGMVGGRAAALISSVMRPWLSSTYRRAAAVISIAPSMNSELIRRGAHPSSTRTVLNWAPESVAPPKRVRAEGSDATLRLLYAGNVGEMQDIETVLNAVNLAQAEFPISLDIFGAGSASARVDEVISELGLSEVQVHGRVPYDEIVRASDRSDFQLVTLKDLPIFSMTIPSKLASSLERGLPVITTVGGDVSDLVERHGVGLACEPESPSALLETFRLAARLKNEEYEQMCRAARSLYMESMSRESGIDAITAVLASAAIDRENDAL